MVETVDQRFLTLGDEIPPESIVPNDLSFTNWSQVGNLIILAGHGPSKKTTAPSFDYIGQVGRDLTPPTDMPQRDYAI